MAEKYYDNSDARQRFQPGTTVESEAVDGKFDEVQAGFEKAERDTRRSLKLPYTDAMESQELTSTPLERRNRVVGFDQDGRLTLVSATPVANRGNWEPGTNYFAGDIVRDSETRNLYTVIAPQHTSGDAPAFDDANVWDLLVDTAGIGGTQSSAEDTLALAQQAVSDAGDTLIQAADAANRSSDSADQAGQFASAASESENKAEKWASEDEDTEVEAGKYSSYHYMRKAEKLIDLPLATEAEKGLVRLANNTEALDPDEHERAATPKTVHIVAAEYGKDYAPKSRAVSAGTGLTGGGDLSANRTIAHANTSNQASVTNTGGNFIQSVEVDGFGHVTKITSSAVSLIPAAGAVGSYAFVRTRVSGNGGTYRWGDQVAGGNLSPSDTFGNIVDPPLSGTWRIMGAQTANFSLADRMATLALRIA